MGISVIPLHLGTIVRDKSGFTYLKDPGVKINAPIISWLVKTDNDTILVDTGTNDPTETAESHKPFLRDKDQELPYLLNSLHIDPKAIKIVIFTHLHWDHCYNTELFPNARFIVQEAELRYANNPLPIHEHAYDLAPIKQTKFTTIKGNREIIEGVTALLTPGHTIGFQSVLLENQNKKILLASDTIPLYENWQNNSFPRPNGAHHNLDEYYTTFDMIKKLNADYILPGHDIKVFSEKVYTI